MGMTCNVNNRVSADIQINSVINKLKSSNDVDNIISVVEAQISEILKTER